MLQEITPTLTDIQVHRTLEIEQHEERNEREYKEREWKSCCFQLHKESSLFFGKLAISIIVITLCSYQLVTNTDNCTVQIGYSSLLSLVVGSWLRV